MSANDVYLVLLGAASVITALNSGRNSKALKEAIDDLRQTLGTHEERINLTDKRLDRLEGP